MKKIPSYPKITAKTNITVTQTQSININSPKLVTSKKLFKNDSKRAKNNPQCIKNESSKTMALNEYRKTIEPFKKSSKKISSKQIKAAEKQKSVKSTKSQRQLEVLSEKLKKLQLKIKLLKSQEKEKKEKLGSASNRSLSKNRESRDHSGYGRKDTESTTKNRKDYSKPMIRNNSAKMLKKSYSDKVGLKLIRKQGAYKKSKALQKISKTNQLLKNNNDQSQLSEREQHEADVIHQFVSQVPNSHPRKYPPNLKQSIEESLRKKTYELSMDQSEHSFQTQKSLNHTEHYYITKLMMSQSKPSLIQFRQHLLQSLQTLHFLQKTRKPSSKQIQRHSLNLEPSKSKFTIILDLDQTLIHCNETLHDDYDVKLNIRFPTGEKIDAGVNIRPFAKEFLLELSKICEIIVFTASHECYANVVLDHLDPEKKIVSYRLFREHCWQTQQGIFIKDLRVLKNRKMDNLLLVDNAAYSYFYQLENGIPIVPYYDDKSDRQLLSLLNYIKSVIDKASANDTTTIKEINTNHFHLKKYIHYEDIDRLIKQLYIPRKIRKQFSIEHPEVDSSGNRKRQGQCKIIS